MQPMPGIMMPMAAGAFDPRNLGPALWLPGRGPYYQDSAKTTGATANNDPIGAWPDASGNARDLAGAGTTRPLLKTAGIGSRVAVAFDGVDDLLSIGSNISTASAGAIWWAGVLDATTGLGVLASFASTTDTQNFFTFRLSSTLSGALEVASRVAGTDRAVYGTTTTLTTATSYVLGLISTGTAWQLRVNAVNQSLTVGSGSNNGGWFGSFGGGVLKNFVLGALVRTTTGNWLASKAAAVLVLDGAPSAGTIAAVETYLGNLVGLSL